MFQFESKTQAIFAALNAAVAAIYAGHFMWTRWQPRVLNLIIYPIKSLQGIFPFCCCLNSGENTC